MLQRPFFFPKQGWNYLDVSRCYFHFSKIPKSYRHSFITPRHTLPVLQRRPIAGFKNLMYIKNSIIKMFPIYYTAYMDQNSWLWTVSKPGRCKDVWRHYNTSWAFTNIQNTPLYITHKLHICTYKRERYIIYI